MNPAATPEPLPEPLLAPLAPLLDKYNALPASLSRRERTLVWLDRMVSELATEIQGDITRKLATRTERRQSFITLPGGTVKHFDEWIERTVLDESEDPKAVPTLSYQALGRFFLGLTVLRHDTRGKVVIARGKPESVIEFKPILSCAAAFARDLQKKGRRARSERTLPDKWTAFRDLAAHLGLLSQSMDPETLKRVLLRAKARRT